MKNVNQSLTFQRGLYNNKHIEWDVIKTVSLGLGDYQAFLLEQPGTGVTIARHTWDTCDSDYAFFHYLERDTAGMSVEDFENWAEAQFQQLLTELSE